eukprot:1183481-Prorocentrum_minimum.AAC.1
MALSQSSACMYTCSPTRTLSHYIEPNQPNSTDSVCTVCTVCTVCRGAPVPARAWRRCRRGCAAEVFNGVVEPTQRAVRRRAALVLRHRRPDLPQVTHTSLSNCSLAAATCVVGLDTDIYGVRKELAGKLNSPVTRWLNKVLNGQICSVRVEP